MSEFFDVNIIPLIFFRLAAASASWRVRKRKRFEKINSSRNVGWNTWGGSWPKQVLFNSVAVVASHPVQTVSRRDPWPPPTLPYACKQDGWLSAQLLTLVLSSTLVISSLIKVAVSYAFSWQEECAWLKVMGEKGNNNVLKMAQKNFVKVNGIQIED